MTFFYLQVNTVIQIPTTTVRILLNHFKWDKEKLMERYYSDDQEAMYVQYSLDLRKILGVAKKFLKSRSFLFQTQQNP